MKISRNWLQTFFDVPLPDAHVLADALTFHAFEIESVVDEILDVKVTPNRGHDCLSHRGIAKELSAILDVPMKSDPLREVISLEPKTDAVAVSIENSELCPRYIACYIKGVKVGPSPSWLKENLEAIGQKSINNIVDAANFVMFNLGQPLHAFDAGKLQTKDSRFAIKVREAKTGEKMLALDAKEYELTDSMLVIVDRYTDISVGIAGVKGGKAAEVNEGTTDIVIESANFNGVSVRKTAQALKLRTDASQRFEQVLSPELAAYGMREAVDLILKIAGGEIVGFADEYPKPQSGKAVSITAAKVNQILGTALVPDDIADVLRRLDLPFEQKDAAFTVTPPFERLDLSIPEDLVEEVGRIIGYDKIPAVELSPFAQKLEINKDFCAAELAREKLIAVGYSEVYTSVFRDKGERAVSNKVGGEKPYLRNNLRDGLLDAYFRNLHNKDLLGIQAVNVFEIGTIWRDGKEVLMVGKLTEEAAGKGKAEESVLAPAQVDVYDNLPVSSLERYQPFSKYPFIVRDIALWVPTGTDPEEVLGVIRVQAGELLERSALFDTFEKNGKLSLAFRLVFQSFDHTLTDGDANERMESIYSAAKGRGWQVR